jgi:hypothetical protein
MEKVSCIYAEVTNSGVVIWIVLPLLAIAVYEVGFF